MPPETPRTTRAPVLMAGAVASGLVDLLGSEQAGVDLPHGDGQRLLVDVGLDQRTDVLEQALAQLGVVGVDLTRALRGVDDQAVLRVGRREQLVDRRVGDALRRGSGAGHGWPS